MAEQNTKVWLIIKILFLVFILTAYFCLPDIQCFIRTGLAYLKLGNFEKLRLFILSYGFWAPVTSIALMTLQSLVPLVPGVILTITNAWVFGWQYGALYSWVGALLGAVIDFGIARWYGRPVVEQIVRSALLNSIDHFFTRHGIFAVFITRIIPIIPFKVVSYGAGLTAISLAQFIFATGVGQTPAIVLYSILVQNVTHKITIAVTSILTIIGVLVFYYRKEIEYYVFPGKD